MVNDKKEINDEKCKSVCCLLYRDNNATIPFEFIQTESKAKNKILQPKTSASTTI